ncbi:ubiquinone biosynthesis protein COQ9-B, mitochondrial [Iris pallida]|uniref:Ubiquinone biosynthesis protein n=1 Tax=Iris pallida TaxID=29817 RepID=A0AAX6ENX0_IRIPA|nr:ubiquinone biosynthesis protein COQ9-B, mitochondrial [Iris pallida]
MFGSMAARRLLSTSRHHHHLLSSSYSFLRHSSAASATSTPDPQSLPPPQPTPTLTPPPPVPSEEEQNPNTHRRSTRSRGGDGGGGGGGAQYEEEQTRVLRASLSHVERLGWGESAMIAGARDVGVSPSIVGSFPRKESALVEFFMDDCLRRLIDKIESGEDLQNLILNDRLSKLIQIRLEMQAPYISKWPQALSIQSQPANLPTSFKQRAELVDEIWHAAGGHGSDIDWYVKRTVLGAIYSTSEVYMVTDHSPAFRDTWSFLDNRIKDAFDLQKTFQEVCLLTPYDPTAQSIIKKISLVGNNTYISKSNAYT